MEILATIVVNVLILIIFTSGGRMAFKGLGSVIDLMFVGCG